MPLFFQKLDKRTFNQPPKIIFFLKNFPAAKTPIKIGFSRNLQKKMLKIFCCLLDKRLFAVIIWVYKTKRRAPRGRKPRQKKEGKKKEGKENDMSKKIERWLVCWMGEGCAARRDWAVYDNEQDAAQEAARRDYNSAQELGIDVDKLRVDGNRPGGWYGRLSDVRDTFGERDAEIAEMYAGSADGRYTVTIEGHKPVVRLAASAMEAGDKVANQWHLGGARWTLIDSVTNGAAWAQGRTRWGDKAIFAEPAQ